MSNPKFKPNILENYRLRPQRKGKLPDFISDSCQSEASINSLLINKIQSSFQIRKFVTHNSINIPSKYLQHIQNMNPQKRIINRINISELHGLRDCHKHLKYQGIKISPQLKVKIDAKTMNQQQDSNLFKDKFNGNKSLEVERIRQLPKINFTSRSTLIQNKKGPSNKQNKEYRASIPKGAKNRNFIRLYHIVTIGRKQSLQ